MKCAFIGSLVVLQDVEMGERLRIEHEALVLTERIKDVEVAARAQVTVQVELSQVAQHATRADMAQGLSTIDAIPSGSRAGSTGSSDSRRASASTSGLKSALSFCNVVSGSKNSTPGLSIVIWAVAGTVLRRTRRVGAETPPSRGAPL